MKCQPEDAMRDKALDKLPVVALIGFGQLGTRIATEFLLLGSQVSVYDRDLSKFSPKVGQAAIDKAVGSALMECNKNGLLRLADVQEPSPAGGVWEPFAGAGPRSARWCASIADAVVGADLVVESVPDKLSIKSDVFTEVLANAPSSAFLATNTLSLQLTKLHMAVAGAGTLLARVAHRLVGLRFLWPVLFIPVVELTLTAAQVERGTRTELLDLLQRWGKSAFYCDVQGAAGDPGLKSGFGDFARERLRLDDSTIARRQAGEARLRLAHRQGSDALRRVNTNFLYGFSEDLCCICLDGTASVSSLLCGHTAVCGHCAGMIETTSKRCPLCRTRFVRPASE